MASHSQTEHLLWGGTVVSAIDYNLERVSHLTGSRSRAIPMDRGICASRLSPGPAAIDQRLRVRSGTLEPLDLLA
jgi:hypothetical protein